MIDYSEVMATKQRELTKLYEHLASKRWVEACILSDKLEDDFKRLYAYCAEKGLEEERDTKSS